MTTQDLRFRLVDRIVSLEEGERIHAQYTWSEQLTFLKDHFAGFPVIPGVLLSEMMGQATGLCAESVDPNRGKTMLAGIKNAVYRAWVKPGEVIDIEGQILTSTSRTINARASAKVAGKLVCSQEFTLIWAEWSVVGDRINHDVLQRFYDSNAAQDS